MVALGNWESCYYFHASSKIAELKPKIHAASTVSNVKNMFTDNLIKKPNKKKEDAYFQDNWKDAGWSLNATSEQWRGNKNKRRKSVIGSLL